jgi:hypothetical protein
MTVQKYIFPVGARFVSDSLKSVISQFWVSSCFDLGRNYAELTAWPMYSTFSGPWCWVWIFILFSLKKRALNPDFDHTPSPPKIKQGKKNSDCFEKLAFSLHWFLTNHLLLNLQFPTYVMFMADEDRYILATIYLHMTRIERDLPVDCWRDSWWLRVKLAS